MTNFWQDNHLWWSTDFEAEENLPHIWDDARDFSESYKYSTRNILNRPNLTEGNIDLYLEYRIDNITDEDTRENFRLIFEDIDIVKVEISTEDLKEIKKWVIEGSDDTMIELFKMYAVRFAWHNVIAKEDEKDLLLYILDSLKWSHQVANEEYWSDPD